MNVLNDLDSQFSTNFSDAQRVIAYEPDKGAFPLFGERDGARAQIQATLALAAATRMLGELLRTGALVNANVRQASECKRETSMRELTNTQCEKFALTRLYWFFRMVDSGGPDGSDLDTEVYQQAREAAEWYKPRLDELAEEAQ